MGIKLGMKARVLLLLFVGVSLLTGANVLQQLLEFRSAIDEANEELFTQVEQSLYQSIERDLSYLSLAVQTLAANPEVVELFAAGERQELQNRLQAYWENLSATYGIAQFQFHLPPATSFLRMHAPSNFGDDLSSFRKTVVDANRQSSPVVGLEVGRGGPGTRVVYPLRQNDRHLGTVEFGGSIGAALGELESVYGIEYAVAIKDAIFQQARRFDTQPTDVVRGELVYYTFSSDEARSVTEAYDAETMSDRSEGRITFVHTIPLRDYTGQEIGHVLAIADRTGMAGQLRMGLIFSIGTALLLATIVLLSAFYIMRWSFRPLKTVVSIMDEISQGEGDLTRTIEISSHDEIGELATYFNRLIGKIGALVMEIKTQARSMGEISSDLSANMTETASAVNQITANIQMVKSQVTNQASGVTEMQSSIETVLKNVEGLRNLIDTQATNVVQSSSSIEEMVANINSVSRILEKNELSVRELSDVSQQGRTKMDEVATLMQEIARSSDTLLEASSVIHDVSSQTNLLSMNAAIEAAHAGEFGKGFAVVASEIGKLAEESGQQAKNITTSLEALKRLIDTVYASTDEAQTFLERSFELTKTVHDQETHIKNAMDEQNSAGGEVLSAIREINDITSQVRDGSVEMHTGTTEIRGEMERLTRLTAELSNAMNEMAAGAGEINDAVLNVDEIAVKNRSSIQALTEEVDRFKTE